MITWKELVKQYYITIVELVKQYGLLYWNGYNLYYVVWLLLFKYHVCFCLQKSK